jgi:Spy/CpxP family protein refolding chaperone
MRVCTTFTALVVWVLLAGFTVPGISRAESGKPSKDPGSQPSRFIEAYAERLGLNEEILAGIRTIAEASRAQEETLRAALNTARAQMHALLSQEMPEAEAVMQQADAIGALELAKRKQRLQAMLRIRALLTPAQRRGLIRLQDEWHASQRLDIVSACQADSANLCADAAHERTRIQCLYDHVEALSAVCRAALQASKRDSHRP